MSQVAGSSTTESADPGRGRCRRCPQRTSAQLRANRIVVSLPSHTRDRTRRNRRAESWTSTSELSRFLERLPPVPPAGSRALPARPASAAHLRAALSPDDRGCAGRRPAGDDRADPPGPRGSPVGRARADHGRRLPGQDRPARAARRRPVQFPAPGLQAGPPEARDSPATSSTGSPRPRSSRTRNPTRRLSTRRDRVHRPVSRVLEKRRQLDPDLMSAAGVGRPPRCPDRYHRPCPGSAARDQTALLAEPKVERRADDLVVDIAPGRSTRTTASRRAFRRRSVPIEPRRPAA